MAKAIVAALRVRSETILDDIARLMELAGVRRAMDPSRTTILKDNISWHFPFPGANTTPWQLEGVIRGLAAAGFRDQVCVQNKTVVTNAFKGEDLNHYVPIFKSYDIPVLYNFRDADMKWVVYKPKASMLVLDHIFPDGIRVPDYFMGKNIVHLPTVKCLSGDTQVVLADGTVTTIRELVSRGFSGCSSGIERSSDGDTRAAGSAELMSMDSSGRILPAKVTWFWRTTRGDRRVLRIRTRTGRTLTATADHLVFTSEGWRTMDSLAPGTRIAAARRIPIRGASQRLTEGDSIQEPTRVIARPGRKYSAAFNQDVIDSYLEGETVTAIAVRRSVPWQIVQSILKRHGVATRRTVNYPVFPSTTSPSFWRWIGYLIAEGNIERSHSTDKIWWTNSEPEISDEFAALTRELFGMDPGRSKDGKRFWIYSRILVDFLESIGLSIPLTAGNKRVPPVLFCCSDEEIAAFVAAYLDGDGHVASKAASISSTTKSAQLARDLQLLYSRLGVIAFVKPVRATIKGKWSHPRLYHSVTVSGVSLATLSSKLQFRHPTKRQRLEMHGQRLRRSKQPSNWDTVPLPRDRFRLVRTGLGLTQSATGISASVNNIEHGYTRPIPRIARYFADLFASLDKEGRYQSAIDEMRLLASPDLAWDPVVSMEEISDAEIELFDITVPDTECFIANGLVVHNCHIYTTTTGAMKNAFGGLLNTKRHYTHSWIHETLVDLLAIQKEIHSGIFAVMDGTTAGNGPGPRTMFPVVKNWMLASADQVAIDALAAKMMGFDPLSLTYIRLAHERGLGCGDVRDIEVTGDASALSESWGFQVGDNGASRVGDLLWFSPLKKFQNFFFRTPLVNVFIMGSEVYHDYYRWPMRDRRAFETWLEKTEWGRMFRLYAERGTLAPDSIRST